MCSPSVVEGLHETGPVKYRALSNRLNVLEDSDAVEVHPISALSVDGNLLVSIYADVRPILMTPFRILTG